MPMGERTTESITNDTCPICKKPMQWTEGLLSDGGLHVDTGRYSCSTCNIFVNMEESRAVRKGRELANVLPFDIHCMDKRVTSQSCGTQIGILREQQHCATCKNDMGEPYTCDGKCNCVYCQSKVG